MVGGFVREGTDAALLVVAESRKDAPRCWVTARQGETPEGPSCDTHTGGTDGLLCRRVAKGPVVKGAPYVKFMGDSVQNVILESVLVVICRSELTGKRVKK